MAEVKTVDIDSVREVVSLSQADESMAAKAAHVLRKWGQLKPVVVRRIEMETGQYEIIDEDGRLLMHALLASGAKDVIVCDLGCISDADALMVRLSQRLRYRTDYAAVAMQVAEQVKAGTDIGALAMCSPFDTVRISHFVELADFDWSKFQPDKSQSAMSWDEDEEDEANG